jgi:hypothetical protein
VRVPFTINTKALETSGKGYVRILQTWNGRYADLKKLLDIFKLKKSLEKSMASEKPSSFVYKKQIRKEVLELINKAKEGVYLNHEQRLAIALELINNGYGDNDIIDIFRKQKDFDEQKTRYFIEHARKKGYKPFSHEKLKEILEGVRS